jgi:hypothetical protein
MKWILKLRRRVTCVPIEVIGPTNILSIILELPREKLWQLFPQGLSARDLRSITYRDIDDLISSIDDLDRPTSNLPPIPPSNEKVEYNNFSAEVAATLKSGFIVQRKFADYFADTSRSEAGNRLAEKFKAMYAKLATTDADADEIFYSLTEAVGGLATGKPRRAAIIGLIAYMFHSCDIFKDVPARDRA